MESMMTASVEDHSPELSGLLAAKSGFAVVEAAFVPPSLPIRPASLWFIAVISLSALAIAASAMVTGDSPVMAAVEMLPAAAAVTSPVPTRPTAEPTAPPKDMSAQPVVLRGQSAKMGHRSQSALLSFEDASMAALGRSGRSN
jgi:hypothetical protein